jgi:hypothetical protein
MCAVGVNTLLTSSAPEQLVHEWYQGLYLDTYSDYLEMARYWYHGHREVGMWMHRAQEQIGEEEETVFAETSRDAFIALATGNTHAHPNYVLARRLESFPLPVHLRKDPRSHYFRETRAALLGHADTEAAPDGAATVELQAETLAIPTALRKHLLEVALREEEAVVERFSGNGHEALSPSTQLVLSPEARLSLEAIDDVVTLVIRSPGGERRTVAWAGENEVVAAFAEATPSRAVIERTELPEADVTSFCAELAAAGVLVPAAS